MQKETAEIRKLGEKALQSAIDWAQWEPDIDDDMDEATIEAIEETNRVTMEDAFNKYTFAKYDFDPEQEMVMGYELRCARLEEAMRLLVNANELIVLDDVFKLHKAFVAFLEKDANWGIPEWQAAEDND